MRNGNTNPKPENESYTIKRASGRIDWDNIPVLSIDKVLWTEDTEIRAQGQLCYDRESLYVHMNAFEKSIRAENTDPLSPVHEDSCLEFFFKLRDTGGYFNFEFNPNGCHCIQFGANRADRFYLVRKDAREYFDITTYRIPDGWEVYYRIPLKFIRMFYPDYLFAGDFDANMYKCGDKTQNRHYLSWNKIDLESPDFHCPDFFGKMHFE